VLGDIEQRLRELDIELPQPSAPGANYVPYVQTGNLVFVTGQLSQWNGERRFVGKLGREFSVEDGRQAARLCALANCNRLRCGWPHHNGGQAPSRPVVRGRV
jgi:enamine deaminase RidA (YjgF/YER057c/UK114 family)